MNDPDLARERRLRAFHVMPAYDIRRHEESRLCWCCPELVSFEDGEEVWSHQAFASIYYPDKKLN